MLKIIKYKNIQEVVDLILSTPKLKVIVPGPNEADALRNISPKEFFLKKIDPVTMSSFVTTSLLKKEHRGKKRVSKSDLLKMLGPIWTIYGPSKDHHLFFQAFQYLTDLRGFTLHAEIIDEIVPYLSEELQKAIIFLWTYIDHLEVIDEQKSYSLIRQYYEEQDARGESYLFFGFGHYNAIQLEMLQEMGRENEILIPINENIFSSIKRSDWPYWVNKEGFETQDLSKNSFNDVSIFPAGKITNSLKNLKDNYQNIVFLGGQKKFNLSQKLYGDESTFKSSIELTPVLLDELFLELRKVLTDSFKVSGDDFVLQLKKMIKSSIESGESDLKVSLKVNLMRLLDEWRKEWDEFVVSDFSLNVLKEILRLDSQRLFYQTTFPEMNQNIYFGNEIQFKKLEGRTLVVALKESSPFKKSEGAFSKDVQSVLSALGPLKNNNFDIYQQMALIEGLSGENVDVLVESGILEEDYFFSEWINENFDQEFKVLESEEIDVTSDQKFVGEVVERNVFSAASLQKYIDCPYSYYLRYEERKSHHLIYHSVIPKNKRGILEHEIIRSYFFSERSVPLKQMIAEIVHHHCVKGNIQLDKIEDRQLILELHFFTSQGLKVLDMLVERFNLKKDQVLFEQKISKGNFFGFVDCILKTEFGDIVLDFKRSKSGVPNKKQVLQFEKIQALSYASKMDCDVLMFGYVSLSNLEESLYFTKDASLVDFMKGHYLVSARKLIDLGGEGMTQLMSEYQSFENNLIHEIMGQRKFIPRPKEETMCKYCPASIVCDKGGQA